MNGSNGGRVQPSPAGTVSRCETNARVGPGDAPLTVTRTPSSPRSTERPRDDAHDSTNCPIAASVPLTDAIATRSRSSSTSVGQVHAKVGRLFLSSHDHGAGSGAGEHFEQQRI